VERAEAEAVYDSGRERCVEFILELARGFERLTVESARLEERVRRLEEQTRSDSRNSSVAPSADPPKTRQQRRAEARAKAKELLARGGGARKAGGQAGHRGSGRKLRPEDQIDEIVDHYPDACGGCGHEFSEAERSPGRRFGRHQVAELPPIAVILTEHRTHRLRCPECKAKTIGVLPGEVAGSAFGPALQAAVVTMTARNRVSRRDMSELAADLFGLGLSIGAVDAICQRASQILTAARGAGRRGPGLAPGARADARRAGRTRRWSPQSWPRRRSTPTRPAGGRPASNARCGRPRPSTPRSSGSPKTATPTARRADRRRLRRDRQLGSLVGLRPPGLRLPSGVLAAPDPRFSPPRRGTGRAEDVR